MPRWLFSVILFVGVASIRYEFKVPNVRNPDLTRKKYKYERPEHDPSIKVPEDVINQYGEGAEKFIRLDYVERVFKTLDHRLPPQVLKEKSKELGFNETDEQLAKFNYDGDINAIMTILEYSILHKQLNKLYEYRTTVIDELLLEQATNSSNSTWSIDVLDEYTVTVACSSPKYGHTADHVFQFRNKMHYAKFKYICPLEEGVDECVASAIMTTPDNEQGVPKDCHGLRTTRGKEVEIQKWRNFHTCEKENFIEKLYPDLAQRLSRVGLYSLYENFYHDDPNAKLALRLVGQQLIRSFREEVPDFTKERIDALEHKERWYWQNKYEHGKHYKIDKFFSHMLEVGSDNKIKI
ncbi:unnamed protein product [Caenorhabditis sp. 36 PRJEB53466]|nr:unnamed protein product [Caenorhabditis sp. 36 PRJEB53466]